MRGQHLTIGRNPDNDIVIDNPAVSGYHARVESVAASFVIRDLDSTNGIFVNKQRIVTHALQHNDIVLIGKHELYFNRMAFDRSARVDQSNADHEKFLEDATRLLDTNKHRELVNKYKIINGSERSDRKSQEKVPRRPGFLSKLLKKILG